MDQYNTGAGLRRVIIRDADGDVYQVRGAVNASGDPEVEEIEVNGDDQVLSKFVTSQREEITLTFNAVTFDALQAITGNAISSSATGMQIPLGTDSQQNAPYIEVMAESLARNGDGGSGFFRKIWYKVQVTNIQVNQAQGAELSCELTATAYKTEEDVEGNALSSARISELFYIE